MKRILLSSFALVILLNVSVSDSFAKNVLEVQKVYEESKIWCDKFNIKEENILAQIDLESGYDSDSVSRSGARGLMQIMPGTARWMVSEMKKEGIVGQDFHYDWKNWKENLLVGIYHMYWLKNYYQKKYPDSQLINASYGAYWMGTYKYERYVKHTGRYSTKSYSEIIKRRIPKYLELIRTFERKEDICVTPIPLLSLKKEQSYKEEGLIKSGEVKDLDLWMKATKMDLGVLKVDVLDAKREANTSLTTSGPALIEGLVMLMTGIGSVLMVMSPLMAVLIPLLIRQKRKLKKYPLL
jgi:hypothetical protein